MPDCVANLGQSLIKYAPWQRDVGHGTVRAVSLKEAVRQRRLYVGSLNHKDLWREFFLLAKVVATAEERPVWDDSRHLVKLVCNTFCANPAPSCFVEKSAAALSAVRMETSHPFASTPLPNAAEHQGLVFIGTAVHAENRCVPRFASREDARQLLHVICRLGRLGDFIHGLVAEWLHH
jgi:hypothetical protein